MSLSFNQVAIFKCRGQEAMRCAVTDVHVEVIEVTEVFLINNMISTPSPAAVLNWNFNERQKFPAANGGM